MEEAGHRLLQIAGGEDGADASSPHDGRSDAPGVLQLSIQVEDVGQLTFAVKIHDVGGGGGGVLVHPHVEGSLEP